jgi:osmotically-inducible protein OsmY
MRTDSEIENNVRSELHWSPDIDTADVAVKAREGVVSLTGFARDCFEKCEIDRAGPARVCGDSVN